MAYDKAVDSTQLNTDLTSVANAIRAKSGGSGQLAFPSGFVSAIEDIPTGEGGGGIPIVVPSEYEQLEYIESDGQAYIDTGMLWTATSEIRISFSRDLSKTWDNFWNLFGNDACYIQFAGSSAAQNAYVKINTGNYTSGNMPAVPPQTLIVTKNTVKSKAFLSPVYLENTVRSQSGSEVNSSTATFAIFGRKKPNGTFDYIPHGVRVYGWEFFENGVTIQELVPSMRKSDSVIGMYDTVSGNFYTNASGSGAFIGGAL